MEIVATEDHSMGNNTNFTVGRVNSPWEVRTFTTRTTPSLLGARLVMRPKSQDVGGPLWSFTTTMSPTLRFVPWDVHLLRVYNEHKYSLDQRLQKD